MKVLISASQRKNFQVWLSLLSHMIDDNLISAGRGRNIQHTLISVEKSLGFPKKVDIFRDNFDFFRRQRDISTELKLNWVFQLFEVESKIKTAKITLWVWTDEQSIVICGAKWDLTENQIVWWISLVLFFRVSDNWHAYRKMKIKTERKKHVKTVCAKMKYLGFFHFCFIRVSYSFDFWN